MIAEVSNPIAFLMIGTVLPNRDLERLATFTPIQQDLELALDFVEMIPHMSLNLIELLLPMLFKGVAKQETQQAIRVEFSEGSVALPLLLWLMRNYHTDVDIQGVVSAKMLSTQSLTAMDAGETGDRLTLRHLIERQFEDFNWLLKLAEQLDSYALHTFFDRIRDTEGNWEPPIKRAIIAQMVKAYPDLVTATSEEPVAEKQRFTSWRTFQERMEQRRKLVEEEIPANAQDINQARSYGDLSENFEYESAKNQQRILLKKQAEMDAELKSMKGTDFADATTNKVGMGTSVTLLIAERPVVYHILGEWDSDEQRRIIPVQSRLAQALVGRDVGDVVQVPYESGTVDAVVSVISELPAEIKDWAMGR